MISSFRAAQTFLAKLCWSQDPNDRIDTALALAGLKLGATISGSPVTFETALAAITRVEGFSKVVDALNRLRTVPECHHEKLLGAAPTLVADDLGLIYEASHTDIKVAKEGTVYTPTWLAQELVEKACATNSFSSLLDPACGGGIFLLSALRHAVLAKNIPADHALSQIYGVDRDETAVAICRATLAIEAMRLGAKSPLGTLSRNIKAGDSLLDDELFAGAHFDSIVGNPPYGLSRDERIPDEEKTALALKYNECRSGKMNKYMLFMARAYQLLSPKGSVAFVVPNSWLGISSGKAIRKMLLDDGALVEVTAFLGAVFENPSVEVVTFVARKAAGVDSIAIVHRSPDSEIPRKQFSLPRSVCAEASDYIIPLQWNREIGEFFRKIDSDVVLLGSQESPVSPLIALQAYARGKGTPAQTAEMVASHIYDRSESGEHDVYRYLQGSDIGRYSLTWSGSFLKYGPWLAEPQELSRFSGPRIAVREILGPTPHLFVATFLDQVALYNKSILNIVPKPGVSTETVLAILGVINSKVGSIIIATRGQKSHRRLFPKIVNADLKRFPVPRSLIQHPSKLANLVKQRLLATEEAADVIEREIEHLVITSYGIKELPDLSWVGSKITKQERDNPAPTLYTA